MIAFLLILGGCVVALVWWAVRATQRQNTDRQLASAERRAHDLFARLEAGIEVTEMAAAVRELENLKKEYAVLGAMSGTDAAGVLRQLEGLKQKIIREQERHGAQPTDQRSATGRQLDYIENLLDSTGTTLSAATRILLGRSVSIDRLSLERSLRPDRLSERDLGGVRVPAKQEPLTCCQMAFEALPETVNERYFRGDRACYENNLLDWLSSPQREQEAGGRIGFAVSAVMSPQLAQTIAKIPEAEWTTYDTEPDGTSRQWAEVVYVPSKEYEHKYSQPLRYVGLRLLKAQGVLCGDGSDRHHYAVVTNLDWDAVRLLHMPLRASRALSVPAPCRTLHEPFVGPRARAAVLGGLRRGFGAMRRVARSN